MSLKAAPRGEPLTDHDRIERLSANYQAQLNLANCRSNSANVWKVVAKTLWGSQRSFQFQKRLVNREFGMAEPFVGAIKTCDGVFG